MDTSHETRLVAMRCEEGPSGSDEWHGAGAERNTGEERRVEERGGRTASGAGGGGERRARTAADARAREPHAVLLVLRRARDHSAQRTPPPLAVAARDALVVGTRLGARVAHRARRLHAVLIKRCAHTQTAVIPH